ncbi:DHH family phosphoesterase [Thermoproteota archaeon]
MRSKNFVETRERWQQVLVEDKDIQHISKKFNLTPLLARLIISRDIGLGHEKDLWIFLDPPEQLITDLDGLADPKDLHRACQRLETAIKKRELVMINGDPDADGITGTAILAAGLREFGGRVSYDFPIRAKEGHGVQPRIIDDANRMGVKVYLTVDCGSKDLLSAKYAKKLGMDMIVTDHHILGRTNPDVCAIINPMSLNPPSLAKNLAGAGVALKLIIALAQHMKIQLNNDFFDYLLALATLGTLSDRMSLKNPMNRIIVKRGIEALNKTSMQGLKALRENRAGKDVMLKAREVGRIITPSLNAPGRIGDRGEGIPDSRHAVDLLLLGSGKKNAEKADEFIKKFSSVFDAGQAVIKSDFSAIEDAAILHDVNERRKFITTKIEDEIEHLVAQDKDIEKRSVVIIQGKNWHPGVIGIDTDRLRDRFLKPAVIMTEYTGVPYVRASSRSIPTINIYDVIDSVSESFEHRHKRSPFQIQVKSAEGMRFINAFGGHSQACGFTFHKSDKDEILRLLIKEMDSIPKEQFNYSYEILDTIHFSQLNDKLIKTLGELSPYGQNFEYPLFFLQGCSLTRPKAFGGKFQEKRTPHVGFFVYEHGKPQGRKIDAVGFGLWDKFCLMVTKDPQKVYDIIFTIEYDMMRPKKKKIRLNVQDIRVSKT